MFPIAPDAPGDHLPPDVFGPHPDPMPFFVPQYFKTRDEARAAIFDYIELFYNRKRIHQSLGYRTPEQVEREWAPPEPTIPLAQ